MNGLLEKFLESCSKCSTMSDLFTSMQKGGLAGFHVAAERQGKMQEAEDSAERSFDTFLPIFG